MSILRISLVLLVLISPYTRAWAAASDHVAWRADAIAHMSAETINLRNKDKNLVAVVNRAKVAKLLDTLNKIQASAGVTAEFILAQYEDNRINASAGSKDGRNVVMMTLPLLDLFGDDHDAYAAVLGHELAHITKEHGSTRQARRGLLQVFGLVAGVVVGAATGVNPSGLINTGTDILINRTFSREEEREADRLGLQYMIGAGFDPEGAVRSHQLLLSAQATAPIAFLSTHPPSEERIQNMRRDIATLRPANKAATQTASVVQMSPQAANASEATKMPVSAIDGGTSRVDKSEKAAALPKDDQSLPTVAAAAAASPSSQSKVSRAGIARLIITSEPLQGLSADVSINGKHLTSVGVDQPFRGTISAGKTIATVPGGRLEFVAEAGTEYRLEIALNPRQGGGFTLLGLVTAAALNQNTFSIYIKEMRVAEDLRPSATEKAAFQPAQPTAVVLSPVANQATNLEMQAAQRLVLAEPLNVSGWRQLGQQYVVMGDTNKALRAYQEAQRLAPSDPETLEELGILYAKNGEKEKTREVWEALNKVDKVRAERLFAAYILP